MALAFPTTRYHRDKAPNGQIFWTEASLPTEAGWFDTPAAFEEGYVPPPPVLTTEGQPVVSTPAAPQVPVKKFPTTRYNQVGDSKTVASAEDLAKLNADEWRGSPADFEEDKAALPAAPPSSPPPADGRRAELYAGTVPDIVARINTITDRAMLDLIRSYEDTNPKGPRKGVIMALQARAAELTPVA